VIVEIQGTSGTLAPADTATLGGIWRAGGVLAKIWSFEGFCFVIIICLCL